VSSAAPALPVRRGGDGHRRRTVPDRVVDQVGDHTLQQRRIAVHLHRRGRVDLAWRQLRELGATRATDARSTASRRTSASARV
jgi:hypothetical protein